MGKWQWGKLNVEKEESEKREDEIHLWVIQLVTDDHLISVTHTHMLYTHLEFVFLLFIGYNYIYVLHAPHT